MVAVAKSEKQAPTLGVYKRPLSSAIRVGLEQRAACRGAYFATLPDGELGSDVLGAAFEALTHCASLETDTFTIAEIIYLRCGIDIRTAKVYRPSSADLYRCPADQLLQTVQQWRACGSVLEVVSLLSDWHQWERWQVAALLELQGL